MKIIKINILLFLFILIITTSNILSQDSCDIPLEETFQEKFIQKEESNILCGNLCNKELMEYISSLTIADQKQIFAQLPPNKRWEYLSQFTLQDYDKFLNAYSEKDWKQLLESLPTEVKKNWPTTIKAQRDALEKIKKIAENTRNFALGVHVIIDAAFPPAMFLHVAEIGYVYHYNVHPIVYKVRTKHFKKYLEETFNNKEL